MFSHDVPGPDEQIAPSSSSSSFGRAALIVVGRLGVVEGGEGVGGGEVADEGGVVARGHRAEQLRPQVVLDRVTVLGIWTRFKEP